MKTRIILFHFSTPRLRMNPFIAVALALCWCAVARAQIAPGPLSRAHQQLDSVIKCASCHDFSNSDRGLKCLECHAEIRRRVEVKSGFHGRNFKRTAGETDCRRCHAEHKGLATPLIRLDRQKFDHFAQTGFALAGKHAQQKCEKCHVATKIAPSARAEIKLKDLNRSFLGLRRDCLACHKDQHQSQLGTDCLRCHNPDGFKPVTGFNHSSTHFPLTGLHEKLPCQKCHGPKPGQETAQFKGLNYTGCNSCHTDPHHGAFQEIKFRGSCDNCHNTNGFKTNHPGSDFNHALTKFPLAGKHTALACTKCHKSADFHRPIAHERCRDCHEDPHKGQFATRAAGSDCSSCHEVTGFKPTRFNRETHRQAAFQLEGKHADLRCPECHQPEGRAAVYISRKLTCPACHTERHGGEFASPPHSNKCDDCHTPAGFQLTTFTVARHAQTQFPLLGKHASVACEKCHKPLTVNGSVLTLAPIKTGGTPISPRQYRFPSRTCNACHTDPHQTKIACDTCHTPEQWQQVRPFEHPTTSKARLDGAHQPLKCIQCHKPATPATGAVAKPAPKFGDTPTRCSGCHSEKDAHAHQFQGGPEEDCANCHVPVKWNGESFSHDKARFVLNRVHINLECAKCHKEQRELAGKKIRVYRDTPAECIKCH